MSQLNDSNVKPIPLFYSYAHRDEPLRGQLESHLSLLKRRGFISSWSDRGIGAGTEWKEQIDQHIELAQIILLLVSADFLASEYCYDVEMTRAMERHEKKEVRVIPLILRPCDWSDAPFGTLQALPTGAKPVTTWSNQDEAWLDVVRGIRLACQEIQKTQVSGIRIFGEKPLSGPLAWPKCAVRLPDAPEASWDLRFGATTYDLSWGQSVMIPLKPRVEYSIIAYTGIPMNGDVGVARITCTVQENEVIQYLYRILEGPGHSHKEIYKQAQLVQVAYL